MKVLAVKIVEIKKLGKCPADSSYGKPNFLEVVSFCLKIKVLIQDLIDLAYAEENEELKYGVYSPSVRDSIQNFFGTQDIVLMRALTGMCKVELEEHIKYVKDYRIRAQSMV